MQIDPEVLEEVEAAGIEFVLEYNRQIAPMQTADIHRDGCTCIRCYRDRLIAALARLRKAMEATRCAECDCEKGGADCNWIKPGKAMEDKQ